MALETFDHMKNLLKQSTQFSDKEGNIFIQSALEAVETIDPELIRLLLSDERVKNQFFISIDGVMVLDQNKLNEFFTMSDFMKNSSYTAYTNKIGLIRKDRFVKKFDDTVLAWPYKDCVLEGGMSTEDSGKKEVFYNAILSKDEIDRLFEPKVLTNIKKFSMEGESIPDTITIEDNLILKGNNLLALHSLKKRYIDQNGGKIKLIYIDPPYNTGNDGFKYNDRFNHSTWLTFMKNRLEVARELLRDDGVIFVSIDDNEQAYLKVLMDEVLKEMNFVALFPWRKRTAKSDVPFGISQDYEWILCYAKKNFLAGVTHERKYYYTDDFPNDGWRLSDLTTQRSEQERPNSAFDMIDPKTGKVYTYNPKRTWGVSIDTFPDYYQKGKIVFPDDYDFLNIKIPAYRVFESEDQAKALKKYGSTKSVKAISTHLSKEVGMSENGNKEVVELFGSKIFSFPKPSSLIKHFLEVSTSNDDIILDFHAGSGTTAHAVLDLNKEDGGNRKFILIEQMDYIETVTAERVKKVIEKNGEGSFVYAELKQIDTFETAEIGRLNENMRYLPIGEIDDEEYGESDQEKQLNKQFYGIV